MSPRLWISSLGLWWGREASEEREASDLQQRQRHCEEESPRTDLRVKILLLIMILIVSVRTIKNTLETVKQGTCLLINPGKWRAETVNCRKGCLRVYNCNMRKCTVVGWNLKSCSLWMSRACLLTSKNYSTFSNRKDLRVKSSLMRWNEYFIAMNCFLLETVLPQFLPSDWCGEDAVLLTETQSY